LEIDDEVRLGYAGVEKAVDLLVKAQLVLVEVQVSEYPVLGEKIIGNYGGVEQLRLEHVLLLLIAAQEEEKLGLEGILFHVAVELGQKSVLFDLFQKGLAAEFLCQEFGKARFAHAYRAFYGYVS